MTCAEVNSTASRGRVRPFAMGAWGRAVMLALGVLCAVGVPTVSTPVQAATKAEKRMAKKLFKRGQLHYRLGRFKQALDAYAKAYEMTSLAPLLFNIGQCHMELGNYDRALFFYNGYLHEAPNIPNRPLVLGRIEEAKRNLNKKAKGRGSATGPAVAGGGRDREEPRGGATGQPASTGTPSGSPDVSSGAGAHGGGSAMASQQQTSTDSSEMIAGDSTATARVAAATPPPHLRAGPAAAHRRAVSDDGGGFYKKWWFWTAIGVVAAGGGAAYLLLRDPGTANLPYGDIGTIDATNQ